MQAVIPPKRRWLELLHLDINCANSLLRLGMTMFHYLVTKDGTAVRSPDAQSWPTPKPGNVQTIEWKAKGFDFVEHVQQAINVALPMTGLDGNGAADLLRDQAQIWTKGHMPSILKKLYEGHGTAPWVQALQGAFKALADVRLQLYSINVDLVALEVSCADYTRHLRVLTDKGNPHPCRTTFKVYDHAIECHVVGQTRELKKTGLSLAMVSSRYLEANNKTVKAISKRLSGGGQRVLEGHTRNVLFQLMRKIAQLSRVLRVVHFAKLDKREPDAQPVSSACLDSALSMESVESVECSKESVMDEAECSVPDACSL